MPGMPGMPGCPVCPVVRYNYPRDAVFTYSDDVFTVFILLLLGTSSARTVRLPDVRHARYGVRGRPNAGPHLRRWLVCEARRATAHHTHEKRHGFEAAPAASGAGHVGPQICMYMRYNFIVI